MIAARSDCSASTERAPPTIWETLAPILPTALMDSLAIPPPTLAKDSLPAPIALPHNNVLMDYIVV
jgi:hypothetical protein